MFISVVICTYDRCESLKDTLESLLNINSDGTFSYEILVVDNNSRDNTREVVGSFVPKFQGRLHYLFESRQGKCYALNSGIHETKGEIIAFTDDDVIVSKDYLNKIAQTFRECGPEVGFVGGKIIPQWLGERPQWVYGAFLGPLALLDYGDKPFVLNAQTDRLKMKLFYGANLIVRKKLFEDHGGFKVEKAVAEDTELCLRFYAAGARGLYNPAVAVYHKVPVSRTSPEYFYRWFYAHGKYRELVHIFDRKFFYPLGIPTWFIRQTINFYIRSLFEKDQHVRIDARCAAVFNLGQIQRFFMDKKQVKNL